MWSVVTVIDGREPLFIPKMFQSLKDVVTIRETESVTEKPGTYTVLVTHRNLEVTQNFVIVDQN